MKSEDVAKARIDLKAENAALRQQIAEMERKANAGSQPQAGSLLRPVNAPLQEGCYCQLGKCGAPVIMGRQMPCRDPQKARGILPETMPAPEDSPAIPTAPPSEAANRESKGTPLAEVDPYFCVWRCSNCGDMNDNLRDTRWRWNGEEWEHACGGPQSGHFPARNFGPHPEPDAALPNPQSPGDDADAGNGLSVEQNRDLCEIENHYRAMPDTTRGQLMALLRAPGLPNLTAIRDKFAADEAKIAALTTERDQARTMSRARSAMIEHASKRIGHLKAATKFQFEAFQAYVEWFGAVHSGECPQDDTCAEGCDGFEINRTVEESFRAVAAALSSTETTPPSNTGSPTDTEMLDWLQSQIDPVKQRANGGFVTQTLEMRNNASIREGIRVTMGSPSSPPCSDGAEANRESE